MMPDVEREARRGKFVPYIGWIMTVALVAEAVCMTLLPKAWQWVPIGVGIVAVTIIGAAIDPPGRDELGSRRRRARSRRGLVAADGADGEAAPAEKMPGRPSLMTLASWLMPRAAGRRWLAEADSLLSEIAPARRARAIRSYLWSAPPLAAMLWVRQALRRARMDRRRPE
jgi:hypothetical protein